MSLFLAFGLTLLTSTLCLFAFMISTALWNYPHLLGSKADVRATAKKQFAFPQGRVFFYGIICFILFLAEGSMLDWGAVLLHSTHGYEVSMAGIGYAIFSVAMSIGRFTGDRLITAFGPIFILRAGTLLAAVGIFMAVTVNVYYLELFGFLFVGFGAANIVPIMFGAAGRLPDISASVALTIVITMGYTGMLLGPAFIGIVAELMTLSVALGGIALLLVGIALNANALSTQNENISS
jgi:fucose permease